MKLLLNRSLVLVIFLSQSTYSEEIKPPKSNQNFWYVGCNRVSFDSLAAAEQGASDGANEISLGWERKLPTNMIFNLGFGVMLYSDTESFFM